MNLLQVAIIIIYSRGIFAFPMDLFLRVQICSDSLSVSIAMYETTLLRPLLLSSYTLTTLLPGSLNPLFSVSKICKGKNKNLE